MFQAGGGVLRALHAYHGVVEALDEHDPQWRRSLQGCAGVSAGALACLTIVVGTTAETRKRLLDDYGFDSKADLALLVSSFAVTDGTSLKRIIAAVLASGGLSAESTLSDLERLLRIRFVCVATDLVSKQVVYLQASTFPRMRVLDAVYASCAMPLLFPPFRCGEHLFVDGNALTTMPDVFSEGRVMKIVVNRFSGKSEDIATLPDYVQSLVHLLMMRGDPQTALASRSTASAATSSSSRRTTPPCCGASATPRSTRSTAAGSTPSSKATLLLARLMILYFRRLNAMQNDHAEDAEDDDLDPRLGGAAPVHLSKLHDVVVLKGRDAVLFGFECAHLRCRGGHGGHVPRRGKTILIFFFRKKPNGVVSDLKKKKKTKKKWKRKTKKIDSSHPSAILAGTAVGLAVGRRSPPTTLRRAPLPTTRCSFPKKMSFWRPT